MQLCGLELKNDIIAAPLAGVSNRAYREILRAHGAGLIYNEMVSAQALCYANRRTYELLDIQGEEGPVCVQLSGSEPRFIAEAAKIVRDLGADWLDLNMGCPMPKITRNGEGAALMRDPQLAAELVRAATEAGLPVSVKIRSGWDAASINAVELAKRLEAAGAALIAVHGRTRDQLYHGQADWRIIAAVKQAVRIPVAGNGDVDSVAAAARLRQESGCDAVMVGRAMLGNPWLFADLDAAYHGREPSGRPAAAGIITQALAHLWRQVALSILWQTAREPKRLDQENRALGELAAVRQMRAHLGWYLKGMRGAAALRNRVNQLTRAAEIEALLQTHLHMLAADQDEAGAARE